MESLTIGETRQMQIIEATIRILSREGIAGATTRKITAEAGVNLATLHYYFGNKNDLLIAVIQTIIQGISATQEHVQTDGGLRVALKSGLTAIWKHVVATPELQMMQYELTLYAVRDPQIAFLAKQQYEGYCEAAETMVRKACEETQEMCAVPPAELARVIVAGLDGLILQCLADRDIQRAERDLNTLMNAVVCLAEGCNSSINAHSN